MDLTTEAGVLFDNRPRLKNKALLLDITIVNPCAGSNLGNAARPVGKHLADAVEQNINKCRDSFPATYSRPPSSRYIDLWCGWLRRACSHQGARHQTGTAQVGESQLFGCTSRPVSYAWELISVSICYSQGDGFNTSLSRFMYSTHASLPVCIREREYKRLCLLCMVIFRGTVMCYP